jgi:hypothetical protein
MQEARLINTSDNMNACSAGESRRFLGEKFGVVLRDWTWYSQVGFI